MKKGFTLVELLGVIIILSVITLLVVPPLLDSINDNKDTISEANKKIVYSAADLYISNNASSFPKYEGSTYCIPLSLLVQNGLLDDKIYQEEKNIDSTTTIKITTNGKIYDMTLVEGNKCSEMIVQPNIDFSVENIGGQNYIVIDTYSSNLEVASIKTSSGEDVERRMQSLKIYVNAFNNNGNETTPYENILDANGYDNYTIAYGTYPTVEYLVNNNYNVFIDSKYVWGVGVNTNDYFDAGINLITVGNDSTSALSIINSQVSTASNTVGNYTANVNNNFTKRLGNLTGSSTDSRYSIKFINGTQVLYSETINGTTYDAIGYYSKNNTKWIHSQVAVPNMENYVLGSLEYISNKNLYYYKVNSHGTYNFTIYYTSGSSREVSYTY